MFRERIQARQLSAWLFTAMVPVAIQLLGGESWAMVVVAGIVGMALVCILWQCPRRPSKIECIFLFIYVVVLMGELLQRTSQSWPVGKSDPAVPLILLALAGWSAFKGLSDAARVGAVLFWVVVVLYLAVFAAGVKDVKLSWLEPQWRIPDELGLAVLLLPAATGVLLKEKGTPGKKGWMLVAFVFIGVLITSGVLSQMIAKETTNAFYEMSRSLDLLGVARRFEALICAGTTVGWFALLSLLLSLCSSYVQSLFGGWDRSGVLLATVAAAGWKLCGLHIKPVFLLLTGAVFWVIIPILTQGLGKIKKS